MYRESQLIEIQQKIMGNDEATLRMLESLTNPKVLAEEFCALLKWSFTVNKQDIYLDSLAQDIAWHHPSTATKIRPLLRRWSELLYEERLLEFSSTDKSPHSLYRQVTVEGKTRLNNGSLKNVLLGWRGLIDSLGSSVVLLSNAKGAGTAFHIGEGRFLSCSHCVENSTELTAFSENNQVTSLATLIAKDEVADVVLLLCPELSHLPWLRISDRDPQILDGVLALHFPNIPALKECRLYSSGELNAFVHNYLANRNDMLISSKTGPGSSGGAVVNSYFEVVGMVAGFGANSGGTSPNEILDGERFYQAIPVSVISCFLATVS